MTAGSDQLSALVAEELDWPLFPAAEAACADIVAAHGETVRAVLFYGSCLREGTDQDKILDFYVLADSPAKANGSAILGFFNWLLPPNVYYRETAYEGRTVRTKYALMGFEQFRRAMQSRLNVSFWARFSQPAALAFARSDEDRGLIAQALGHALVTF
ncbi:MAG: hypothetical protein R3360_00450, partial [Alphaproteobacteria bacterium]|nr:hypothetical protein [Alphaproteobacteria bacterium]